MHELIVIPNHFRITIHRKTYTPILGAQHLAIQSMTAKLIRKPLADQTFRFRQWSKIKVLRFLLSQWMIIHHRTISATAILMTQSTVWLITDTERTHRHTVAILTYTSGNIFINILLLFRKASFYFSCRCNSILANDTAASFSGFCFSSFSSSGIYRLFSLQYFTACFTCCTN